MSEISSKSITLDQKVCILSNNILQLYNNAAVKDRNEAIAVLFHALMLDSGFSPKDVLPDDKYSCMPKDWNAKGIFKIKYEHVCCSSYTCCMTCVPLYSKISVHGIICNIDCSESVDLKVNVKKCIKESKDVSNIHEAFSNLEDLSLYFKDHFCLPLLNLLHETIGVNHLFGLKGLYDEILVNILQFLPVESVVSISGVNKHFNYLANLPILWKYLYKRDFAAKRLKNGIPDFEPTSSDTNWKQMYMREYKVRKRFERALRRRPPFLPGIFGVQPDFETGRNFYTDIDTVYPHFPDDFPTVPTDPFILTDRIPTVPMMPPFLHFRR